MTSNLITLSNGVKIPQMGFGTWQLKENFCYNSVTWALQQGFQLIDTATAYGNEEIVGQAVKDFIKSGKPSGNLQFDSSTGHNIFVTTKVPPSKMGKENVYNCVTESLSKLNMQSVDCVLLHWPGCSQPWESSENRKIRHESWKALEQLYNDKKVRSIGVSNYYENHLNQLLEDGVEIVPHINQVEMHPHLQLTSLEKWSKVNNVILQAYSSLGTGTNALIESSEVLEVAKEIGCTPGQALLKWAYQKNYAILPRTTKQERVKENWDTLKYTLNDSQMDLLNSLDIQHHYCWDPRKVA